MSEEKTESASEFKLSKAKKDGKAPKSMEFNAAICLITIIALFVSSVSFVSYFESLIKSVANSIGMLTLTGGGEGVIGLFEAEVVRLAGFASVIISVLIISAVLSNISQVGLIFSFKVISPDMSKINPISGFNKIFNKKIFYDLFRMITKLILGGVIFYYWFLDAVGVLNSLPIWGSFREKLDASSVLALEILLLLLILIAMSSLVDVLYVRRKYVDDMKMSKQELKDENKGKDGDPEIKSRRKKYMSDILKNAGVVGRVPESDFIIVNPTHLAVLIKYDREVMSAPKVIGKVSGGLVQVIKRVAKRKGVNVIQDKMLARKIYKSASVNRYIPLESYAEVAEIYKRFMKNENI